MHLPDGRGPAVFSSADPLATLERALDFARYTQLARQAVLSGLAWETTLDEWIRGLPLRQSFKDAVLYPWITALIGCSRARRCGRRRGRSCRRSRWRSRPNLLEGATTFNSKIGLQGNLQRLLDRSPSARVHVTRLRGP